MTLPVYSTGTVAVDHLGTVVTGSGGLWSGINAREGDFFTRADGVAVITEVTDATHLQITPGPGATVSGGSYAIQQNYVGRVVGVAAAEDVGVMLEKLHTDGLPFIVGPDETVPDPSYGDEGQMAFKPDTGAWWVKSGGAWVHSIGLAALGYGGVSATSLALGLGTKAFTTQTGLAYNGARVRAASSANLNNFMEGVANYSGNLLTMTADTVSGTGVYADWLFSIAGDKGATGPTGPAGATGPTGAVGNIKISTTAPTTASPGDLWFESDTGMFYVYYNDGDSLQWVAVIAGTPGGGDVVGPAGAVDGRIAVFNGVTGKLVKDSGNLITDLAPISSPSFTGDPRAPTPAIGDNDLSIATTAFVSAAVAALFAGINVQKFTASGTYTPSAKMLFADITCLGGGGGGGGVTGQATMAFGAGGGGAGSVSRKIASKAAISPSQIVTIGAAGAGGAAGNNSGGGGGDSSVASFCIGKGGGGGGFNSGGAGFGGGGLGGVLGTGDVTSAGASGTTGSYAQITTVAAINGMGGSSAFGGSLSNSIVLSGTAAAGGGAQGFGAGGSGAFVSGTTNTAAGGPGSAGLVIIVEYLGS